ncbi:hypothetical protein CsSME_00052174 [Camellia sinensis var. sinensis]
MQLDSLIIDNSFRDLSVLIVYAALLFRSRHAAVVTVLSWKNISILMHLETLDLGRRKEEEWKGRWERNEARERGYGREGLEGGREEGREGEGKVEHTSDREWPYLV